MQATHDTTFGTTWRAAKLCASVTNEHCVQLIFSMSISVQMAPENNSYSIINLMAFIYYSFLKILFYNIH